MKKNILITSGGTVEHIDEVRVLTNISTGKLGAAIAEKFSDKEKFCVYYLAPKSAVKPTTPHIPIEVTDVKSVFDIMKFLVPQMDVVIHCMAVSDFGFLPIEAKLKSNDPMAFIDSLKERIYQTPKILKEIKKWNPDCFLVSFKFEVGLSNSDLIEIARKSKIDNGSDIVIANDKEEIKEHGVHIAYAVGDGSPKVLWGKEIIAINIFNEVELSLSNFKF